MVEHVPVTSIKKALIYAIMSVTTVGLVLSISLSTYTDIQTQKKQIIKNVETLAELTAANAASTVLSNISEIEEQQLRTFDTVKDIKNIHIYRINANSKQLEFFASYNAFQTLPVPLKTSQIKDMPSSQLSNNKIEVVRAIKDQNEIIGYVYILASLEGVSNYIHKKVLFSALLGLIVLLLAYFIARIFQRIIGDPIGELSLLLQDIAQNHNYQARASHSNIVELNRLATDLNTMLIRTEKQIARHTTDKLKINALNQSLEEKVNDRTEALRAANKELIDTLERMHQYQGQIVENEKMASLGQMVAGVAHEVNTPLGIGVTSSTALLDKTATLQKAFDAKTLTSVQLQQFLSQSTETLELVYRNLSRASELISRFKTVAVNQHDNRITHFNVKTLLEQVVSNKNNTEVQPRILIECADDLVIHSKIEPLHQVFQQLFNNSLLHAFAEQNNPEIIIKVTDEHSALHILYSDNGAGIPSSIQPKVFDPFVTTKRGEGGSGLGLHLVYNLVTQALGGTIKLLEKPQGAHFLILIPINNDKGESDNTEVKAQ